MRLLSAVRYRWGHVLALGLLVALSVWLAGVQTESQVQQVWTVAQSGWAASLVFAYACGCLLVFRRHRIEAARSRVTSMTDGADALSAASHIDMHVVHASQTGFADMLAERTTETLRAGGLRVRRAELARFDPRTVQASQTVLLVVSTTGEGDAPDSAAGFLSRMAAEHDLSHVRFGMLSLGDSSYTEFCGFGRQLDRWLRTHGATPVFDTVEVDDGDESALRHWQHHIALLTGRNDLPDWQAPAYSQWRLARRVLLNPGSLGAECFLIELAPPAGQPCEWQAGDIAEIGPRNDPERVEDFMRKARIDGEARFDQAGSLRDQVSASVLPSPDAIVGSSVDPSTFKPLPHREYSIASLPIENRLNLVVRRMHGADGRLGIGSGWLTMHASVGDPVDVRIRSNTSFHPPASDVPMILIGNGTGMAGLRAHLKARIAAGSRRNWLLFGERNADRDFLFGDEVRSWQSQGMIERLDLAFSRDQVERIYVQQRLREAQSTLRAWMADGAVIYVCGSLTGMAPGVHAVLTETFGERAVIEFMTAGRYRRDVY